MEKIFEKQNRNGLPVYNKSGKKEKQYSYSGTNDSTFAFTQKRNHFMFVVDWQMDNTNNNVRNKN